MSFVGPPFTHDVFVTYSHGDAQANGQSLVKQWSQAFARELESELATQPGVGPTLSLFLDQNHRPGQGIDPLEPLSDQLQREIGASAIIAVLMSPQYLGSKWCSEERAWWREQQRLQQVPHEGRVALARIWPLPQGAVWPELFVDGRGAELMGCWFYDRGQDAFEARPYEWPAASSTSGGPFRAALVQLASSIYRHLSDLKLRLAERQSQKDDAVKLASSEQLVYLHGRADRRERWEETSDALTANGFTVLPGEPDPIDPVPEQAQRIRERRVDTLTGCDALLLLGSEDGRAVEADLAVVGRYERQLARARSNRLLPCALLDPVGPPLATDRRLAAAHKMQVDWLDRKSEPWVPAVRTWLAQKGRELMKDAR